MREHSKCIHSSFFLVTLFDILSIRYSYISLCYERFVYHHHVGSSTHFGIPNANVQRYDCECVRMDEVICGINLFSPIAFIHVRSDSSYFSDISLLFPFQTCHVSHSSTFVRHYLLCSLQRHFSCASFHLDASTIARKCSYNAPVPPAHRKHCKYIFDFWFGISIFMLKS